MSGPTFGDRTIVELAAEDCLELLAHAPVGRVIMLDGDQPVALPVCHAVHDRAVVFKTVPGGTLDAASRAEARVGFEVDGLDPESSEGWSVLVRGRAHVVHEPEELAALEEIGLASWLPALSGRRWSDDAGKWEPIAEYEWVRISTETLTGRRTAPASRRPHPRRS